MAQAVGRSHQGSHRAVSRKSIGGCSKATPAIRILVVSDNPVRSAGRFGRRSLSEMPKLIGRIEGARLRQRIADSLGSIASRTPDRERFSAWLADGRATFAIGRAWQGTRRARYEAPGFWAECAQRPTTILARGGTTGQADRMARLHTVDGPVKSGPDRRGDRLSGARHWSLAFVFLNGVIRRLAVLRENARRFAEGKALAPPLSGSDEIAEVDRAFHEMATSLDQQKQENEMFVYSVSHDLRSPLINLQGFSEELSLSYRELARSVAA